MNVTKLSASCDGKMICCSGGTDKKTRTGGGSSILLASLNPWRVVNRVDNALEKKPERQRDYLTDAGLQC
jgi:hypothetical protein